MSDALLREALDALYDLGHTGVRGGPDKNCRHCLLYDRIQQHLDTGGWIKCSERLPTKRDANEVGEVLMLHKVHKVPVIRHWKMVAMFGSDPQDTSMADASWQPLPPLPRSE